MIKKILALVLARKGSTRLKNKNIKILGNKPLINFTLDNLKKIKHLFEDVVVCSDSKIVEIYTKKKKFIFIKRPKKISLDNTTSGDTAIYAIRKYEKKFKIKTDYVILFQPTSPFRKNTTVKKIIKLSKKHSNNQIVTVSLKNKKKPNGVLYLTPRNILFKRKNFSYKNFKSVILKSKKETLDIDTIDDFNFAKKLLNTKLK